MIQELAFESVAENLHLEMHNVTYRTELLKKNRITLDNGFYTDVEYLLFPTPYIRTIVFLDQMIYMYRVSLATQSMNIKSLQKNEKMHRQVLDHLMHEYEEYRASKLWNVKSGAYYCKRIASMAGTQLSIYLSFKDVKTYKKMTSAFTAAVKKDHSTIYHEIMKLKTYKLLVYSDFILYGVISLMHRKKLNIQ